MSVSWNYSANTAASSLPRNNNNKKPLSVPINNNKKKEIVKKKKEPCLIFPWPCESRVVKQQPVGATYALYIYSKKRGTPPTGIHTHNGALSSSHSDRHGPQNVSHSLRACRIQQIRAVKAQHWRLSVTCGIFNRNEHKQMCAHTCITTRRHADNAARKMF